MLRVFTRVFFLSAQWGRLRISANGVPIAASPTLGADAFKYRKFLIISYILHMNNSSLPVVIVSAGRRVRSFAPRRRRRSA
jgi:hypothetical protein